MASEETKVGSLASVRGGRSQQAAREWRQMASVFHAGRRIGSSAAGIARTGLVLGAG